MSFGERRSRPRPPPRMDGLCETTSRTWLPGYQSRARTEGRSGAAEALSLALEPVRRRWSTDSVTHTLRHLDAAHRRLVVALVEAEEAALRRSWHAAYPDSLAANVARNTYQHYSEHLPAIRRLLSTSQVEKIPLPLAGRVVRGSGGLQGALRPGGLGGGRRPRRRSAS